MKKEDLLKQEIKHIDIKQINTTQLIDSMRLMSFSSREIADATDIFMRALNDKTCTNFLTLAGSTSAAGCMQVYVDMVKEGMIDCIVATGASIVDMDFFEALGFKHYRGTQFINDNHLRECMIDRIYDTFISEEDLQNCDSTIEKIANGLEPRAYSSREFIMEMGRYLTKHSVKKDSLVQVCFEKNVPIFCPAFTDSSAGFGLVLHRVNNPDKHITIDSIKDFHELTLIKMKAENSSLFMVGGGVPKNFLQDTVVCAEVLGHDVPMHKYAIQITVADVRDGACSSSTLKEASSWGKVDTTFEQMVYAEATTVVPLMVSYAYHNNGWKEGRKNYKWTEYVESLNTKK